MKVGDYVRTNIGIGKIINVYALDNVEIDYGNPVGYFDSNWVIKASDKPIELRIYDNNIQGKQGYSCIPSGCNGIRSVRQRRFVPCRSLYRFSSAQEQAFWCMDDIIQGAVYR